MTKNTIDGHVNTTTHARTISDVEKLENLHQPNFYLVHKCYQSKG